MTTWNRLTIDEPKELTLDWLQDQLTDYLYEAGVEDEREPVAEVVSPDGITLYEGRPGRLAGSIIIEGESKYHRTKWDAVVKSLSAGRTITWSEEWDDDGGGVFIGVWRDGELVREESKKDFIVPLDLELMIADIRTKLRESDSLTDAVQETLDFLELLDPESAPLVDAEAAGQ